jgi:hypothetical protein
MSDPITLFFQAGMVGVFMAFVIWMRREEQKERVERNTNWQAFIQKQNDVLCQGMKDQTEVLSELLSRFEAHDKNTAEGFAVMLDRNRRKTAEMSK